MNKYIITIIILLNNLISFGQVSSNNDGFFNVGVTNTANILSVTLEYDGSIVAGTAEGLPTTNESLADMAFTLRWPASTTIVLGSITNVGGISFVKSGGVLSAGGFNYQKFISSGAANFASNMTQNTPYELFTIPMTSVSGGGIVEVAPLGYLPNQPSLQIDYFNTPGGDIYEYFPPDITSFAPLPIDIKTFSATKDGERNARLDWSTSLEINSAFFGIQRSADGKSWEGITKVAAAGNSNTEQFYTYTDRDLPLNRNKDQIFYYRLQLVDLDGQYKYSDIRGVNFGKADSDKIISLYPNPAVQMVNLDLSGMDLESGDIHLRVSDMQGRNMIDKSIYGNGIEPVDVTQLPAGTYNVAITQGQNLYQKQFIKID